MASRRAARTSEQQRSRSSPLGFFPSPLSGRSSSLAGGARATIAPASPSVSLHMQARRNSTSATPSAPWWWGETTQKGEEQQWRPLPSWRTRTSGGAGVYFSGRGRVDPDVSAGRAGGGSSAEEDKGAQHEGQPGAGWGKRRADSPVRALTLFGWMARRFDGGEYSGAWQPGRQGLFDGEYLQQPDRKNWICTQCYDSYESYLWWSQAWDILLAAEALNGVKTEPVDA